MPLQVSFETFFSYPPHGTSCTSRISKAVSSPGNSSTSVASSRGCSHLPRPRSIFRTRNASCTCGPRRAWATAAGLCMRTRQVDLDRSWSGWTRGRVIGEGAGGLIMWKSGGGRVVQGISRRVLETLHPLCKPGNLWIIICKWGHIFPGQRCIFAIPVPLLCSSADFIVYRHWKACL